MKSLRVITSCLLLLTLFRHTGTASGADLKLLNVSYDVTREFYREYNPLFVAHWKQKTGQTVVMSQSHEGSTKQARAVIEGLKADVVTMNQALDIDMIHERAGLIPANWATRLPNQSVPYTSTILFVVRSGNPKKIKDWDDLVRPGVSVIVPNPKTSGNGRYSYLAAWGFALKAVGGDETKATEFLRKLFANAPVLATGGRGATTTFVQQETGDVLLTFESEALAVKESAGKRFELIVPSVSIRADNPVSWVDKVVAEHGALELARAYLEYLYSPAAQELIARHNFRPQNAGILAKHSDQFKPLTLFGVDEIAGGWREAQKVHFADGGRFEQIFKPAK